MRLIDADVLVERWKRLASVSWNETIVTSWSYAYEEIISEIEEEPTIEAEQVRHGEWIIKERGVYLTKGNYVVKCNKCGHTRAGYYTEPLNYCPNCGAKMKEVE